MKKKQLEFVTVRLPVDLIRKVKAFRKAHRRTMQECYAEIITRGLVSDVLPDSPDRAFEAGGNS